MFHYFLIPFRVSAKRACLAVVPFPFAAFSSFFSTKFELKKLVGLPAFLPPAYLSDYYIKFKNVASMLEKFEWALGGHFPFNRVGDQSLFVFQKR